MWRFLICLLALLIAITPSFALSTSKPVTARTFFPDSELPEALQRRLARRVLGKNWLQDPEIKQYLNHLENVLTPEEDYFIAIADTEQVNAFAYLGGIIVLYKGLWKFARSEDEFLSVLAHEMGHVKLDHFEKQRENSKEISTLATPFLIAGLLIEDKEVREAVVAGSAGIITGDIIAYSRELEHEADVFGLDLVLMQGRSGQAMADIFSRLGSTSNEYLSTHPAPERRGAYLAARLHNVPPPPPLPLDLRFYLLREKLSLAEVVPQEFESTRRHIIKTTKSLPQATIAHYGLLLLATQTRNTSLGEEMSAALMDKSHPYIVRAIAENLMQRKKYGDAYRLLTAAQKQSPNSIAVAVDLMHLLIAAKRYQQVLELYGRLPPALREDIDILHQTGLAASYLEQGFLANYYFAHQHAKDGKFEQALKQIAVAEKFKSTEVNRITELHRLKKILEKELKKIKEQLERN